VVSVGAAVVRAARKRWRRSGEERETRRHRPAVAMAVMVAAREERADRERGRWPCSRCSLA
jgi:hypothetical protein